ncbi:hypothetical protein LPJ75_000810 [Coemansia sp. RSA 2598]|nr:hypothetical protein LPJ75_000810 [Coemansia sp. RSA 2598]
MHNTRDGDYVAMDGPPQALEAAIVGELQFFRKHSIVPVFVFNGLPVSRKDQRPFAKDDHRLAFRNAAWEAYWQGNSEQAQRGWSTSSPHAQSDMIPYVMQVLQAHGAECMRAPYSSWAQLAYLYRHEAQPIHAVYASLDVLMFDVERVVTAISASKATFTWIQRDSLLTKCGISADQLLDMCILAGFDWCPTFPPLVSDIGFSFKAAVDAVVAYRTGFNAVQMLGDCAPSYSDSFLRAYCTVRYHIVLHLDGSVGPLNAEYAPNDLHDIIGYRLPTAAYHLLARGIVQPPVLNMLISGSWLEFAPADNGESAEYRRLVTEWERSLYQQQCATLCTMFGSFYRQRKITMQTWFEPQTELVLHDSKSPTKPEKARSRADVRGAPDTDGVPTPAAVLERAGALMSSQRSTGGDSSAAPTASAAALVSALCDLGFVSRTGHHTPLGAALGAGMRALASKQSASPSLQWAAVEAAILLSQGMLSGTRWSVAYEDERAPAGGSDATVQKHVRFISRIAALVPPCQRSGPWRLAFSRDLLAFHSAARLVQKAVATSVDASCLAFAAAETGGVSAADTAQLLELKGGVPLECASSDASGLLVQALLVEHARGDKGSWKRVLEAAGDSIADPAQTVRAAACLVDAVLAMACEQGSGVDKGVVADLKAARDWALPALSKAV